MPHAIETSQLTKNYGNVHAVSDLNLQVVEGEIYAFLGLNVQARPPPSACCSA